MRSPGPSVIQFSVLESVSRPLLVRLAARLGRAQSGLPPDDVAAALYHAATRDDCDEALREALDGIAALSSDHGADTLLDSGLDRDVDLAHAYGACSSADIAVLAYLEHPEAFQDARAQVRAVHRRMFAVFACAPSVAFAPAQLRARLPWLKRQVAARLQDRGRPGTCRAIVTETGPLLVVDIVVQGAPFMCITPGGSEVLASKKHQDTLVFDRSAGCLSVHARSQCEVEFYRELAGQLVCEDPYAFRSSNVFQLRRLLRQAEWECKRHAVPGLSRVVLRGIEVQAGPSRMRWRGAAELSSDQGVDEVLERADLCTRVELELHAEDRAYPCAVEILPPNRILLDQRAIGSLASAYLKAWGLLVAA